MRTAILFCSLCLWTSASSAQTITVVSSSNNVMLPLGQVSTEDQFTYLLGWWDSSSSYAEATDSGTAYDFHGGGISIDLLATAEVYPYPVDPVVMLECYLEATIVVGAPIHSGTLSYSGTSESSATLQIDGANPLDPVEVRILVGGGAGSLAHMLDTGIFGFDYEDDYFEAVVLGEEFDSYENTMDFDFILDPTFNDTTMSRDFYVELPSGSQIDVGCHAGFAGADLVLNDDTGGGMVPAVGAGCYATMVVQIVN